MKIIAKAKHDLYICEVSHSEIEKCLNKYYGSLKSLEVGDSIDIGSGYDFSHDIKTAMETTRNFINDNSRIVEAILRGLTISSSVDTRESEAAQ